MRTYLLIVDDTGAAQLLDLAKFVGAVPTAVTAAPEPQKEPPKLPPITYTIGKGIDAVCPSCGRHIKLDPVDSIDKVGKRPTEVDLPCGCDRIPMKVVKGKE